MLPRRWRHRSPPAASVFSAVCTPPSAHSTLPEAIRKTTPPNVTPYPGRVASLQHLQHRQELYLSWLRSLTCVVVGFSLKPYQGDRYSKRPSIHEPIPDLERLPGPA